MTKLTMTSWKKGLQTVSLIKAVKKYSTGSLVSAKAEVERLLAGEAVTLEFPSESARDEFKKSAEAFGVAVKLNSRMERSMSKLTLSGRRKNGDTF